MTTDEKIKCDTHGTANSTFVCQHLIEGEKLGFNLGYDPDDPNDPYPDAWCDKCEIVSDEEGGWNEKSQAFANIKLLCSYCYEDIRERNWIQGDQEWDKLVSSSCQWLHKRQEKILTKFKVDEHDRWDRDQETGILTFSHKGEPQVEAEFHFTGSFSKKSNTWMWAWANNSYAEKVKAASQKIKELGEQQKFLCLSAHINDATEEDAGHYTAIMAKELDAIGSYRTTENELTSYMVITKARWVKKKKFLGLF